MHSLLESRYFENCEGRVPIDPQRRHLEANLFMVKNPELTYYQIPLKQHHIQKTAITTTSGLFELPVMESGMRYVQDVL